MKMNDYYADLTRLLNERIDENDKHVMYICDSKVVCKKFKLRHPNVEKSYILCGKDVLSDPKLLYGKRYKDFLFIH